MSLKSIQNQEKGDREINFGIELGNFESTQKFYCGNIKELSLISDNIRKL